MIDQYNASTEKPYFILVLIYFWCGLTLIIKTTLQHYGAGHDKIHLILPPWLHDNIYWIIPIPPHPP